MTATPPQGIDRDAVAQVFQEHSYAVEEQRYGKPGDWADRILGLVRPVEGVTLTREEAKVALIWWDVAQRYSHLTPWDAHRALASRLEAAQ